MQTHIIINTISDGDYLWDRRGEMRPLGCMMLYLVLVVENMGSHFTIIYEVVYMFLHLS